MKAILFAIVFFFPYFSLAANPTPPVIPKSTSLNDKINLNEASLEVLSHSFKGIGKKRAEAIIQYRQSHGKFKQIEQLKEVKGIGKQFGEKNLVRLQEIYKVA